MTTIGDPLILSRHEISPKTIPQSRPVLGSCSKGVKDEYASIGIVGEGISIIDLTSLQPDAATLLGPETTFACPPVSRTVTEESRQQLRQTYAATETHSSGSATKGTTISYWTSSATLSSLEKHRSLTSGQSIQALYAPSWHIDALIVVFTDGDVAKLDSKLEEANFSKKRHNPRRRLIWSFIFDPSSSSLVWKHKEPNSSVLLSVIQDKTDILLRHTFVGSSVEHGEELPLQLTGEIIASSCENSGCISFFGKDGVLSSYLLESHRGKLFTTHLDSLKIQSFYNETASLLCLGSTHIILVGITRNAGDIAILLWDVQYSVLLSEQRLPIPSNLSSIRQESLRLQLIRCNESQSMLIVAPDLTINRPNQLPAGAKSNILLIPHTFPQKSSLANAIGKADAGKAWLNPSKSGCVPSTLDEQREGILRGLTESFQKDNIEAADTIFFDWINEQTAAIKAAVKAEAKRYLAVALGKIPEDGEMPEDMEIDKEEVKRKGIVVKHIPNTLNLGHQFITSVLELVFRQESLRPGCYSPKIVAYLLERRLITDSSVKGGLLKALEDRGDWHAITHMLRDTVDISEDALMSLLVNSLRRTRREDAMEVDESSKDPTKPLPCTAILGYVISYPTTAPTMRLAIRKHLTDMDDVLFILNHLKNMMQKSVQGNEGLSLGDLEKEFKGHEVDRRRLTKHGRPKLEMIISFLSTMLDAKLLDITQYQPTHDLLREIHEFTLPQITWLTTLEKLRGPLEPFVTADKKGSKQPHGDNFAPKQQKWREKKVDSHALTVGLYQLEEFTI